MTEQNKPREWWIYYFKSGKAQISTSEVTLNDEYISEPNQARGIKPIKVDHVIEYSAYEQLKVENERLRVALRAINREEINSQRPGGGYSRSATISFEALAKGNK
jgi:hypothetical protein